MTVGRPVAGILWMALTGLCFVAVTAIVKHVGDDIPAPQAAFLRYLMGLVFFLPAIGAVRRAGITARQARLFALRGTLHTVAVACWFYAMTRITIAEVTAMNYLTPVLVTFGAALLMGEGLPRRRLIAVVVALLGALLILRPGVRALDPGHGAMLVTALFFAASYMLAKRLSGEVPALVIVAVLSVTVTIGLAPLAAVAWVTPGRADLAWLSAVAVFASAGHYAMTRAFAAAPLTATQPVTFLQLVWAVILGVLLFAEPVDPWVLAGGAVIMGAVLALTWREARARVTSGRSPPAI
ncbi:DMT family transporter [Histidinibacterium lentulum]|uniref:DMT family transporter n=1 Tax=Histidinibacterium lentulum TaxID=2480588 RepID=A0A3N2R7J9_9RHOB|nr:DMT family transporter [Histidinibacterium lentulum]ROU03296.1 DMT family transporter [Histidinibacterium lentulum]